MSNIFLFKNYGAPNRSRTHNLLIRSQTLYPVELQVQKKPSYKKNGGEGGIRTLDPSFSPDTPLAGERIRPALPLLQNYI